LEDNIAHIVNPNIDIINKLKENPDMLQKLADMEASNPGTMQRLGMGNLSGLSQRESPNLVSNSVQTLLTLLKET
jgi:hypothetical protein